jgi:hypothetical protein
MEKKGVANGQTCDVREVHDDEVRRLVYDFAHEGSRVRDKNEHHCHAHDEEKEPCPSRVHFVEDDDADEEKCRAHHEMQKHEIFEKGGLHPSRRRRYLHLPAVANDPERYEGTVEPVENVPLGLKP